MLESHHDTSDVRKIQKREVGRAQHCNASLQGELGDREGRSEGREEIRRHAQRAARPCNLAVKVSDKEQ